MVEIICLAPTAQKVAKTSVKLILFGFQSVYSFFINVIPA